MRLISCHIENFGKLNDVSLAFDDPSGINVLCEKNGWGKSTLATFIKVMFFGFDNEGKRNNVENERQHFKPWQGGAYGGQFTFEADEKTYTILRTFGVKEKDDEFVIQDAETKLALTNYSKNIGEELFQIDSASFARSIYISQNGCITATTDSINAKLGNLTDNTDDLNNYETAAKKIADRLNAMSRTRKTGELYKQKEQITQLKQEIKQGEAIDASMEGLLKLKNDLHASYETLKDEQKQLQDRQKAISEYKDILVKKKEYEHLCTDEAKKRSLYESKKALFPERIPEAEEIDKYITLEYQTSVLKKNLDFNRLTDEENAELDMLEARFSQGLPTNGEIERAKGNVNDMQTLIRNIEKNMLTGDEADSLERLGELFADGAPTEAEIDALSNAWSLRSEKKNILSSKKAAVDMLKMTEAANGRNPDNSDNSDKQKAKAAKKRTYIIVAALAVSIALAAVSAVAALTALLRDTLTPYVGMGVLAADFIAVIVWIGIIITGKRSKNSKVGDAEEETKTGRDAAPAPYLALQREIETDEALIYKTETDIRQFFDRYGISYEENSVISGLYQLKENIKLYGRIREKAQNSDVDRLKADYNSLRSEVDGFLRRYGLGMDGENEDIETIDLTVYYVNLIHKLETYINKYSALKSKKDSFEKNYAEYTKNTELINSFIGEIKMEVEAADAGTDTGTSTETDTDLSDLLHLIKETRAAYFSAKLEYENASEAKNEYEMKNREDIDAIKDLEESEEDTSLAEIEKRLSEISTELENCHTNMASYDRQLDELQEKRDEITDSENRLSELQELYELNDKKLGLLQKTQKYLEQAKISLTAKYTRPIKEGFDKYFGILCDIEAENYQLDANLDMSVLEQGLPRDIELLSTGYQDMIGICMRMALIDAMYKEEKPFVIFDDPFVNLDDEKTKGALKLLDVIAKEYQVVYFTCNESRR